MITILKMNDRAMHGEITTILSGVCKKEVWKSENIQA
jgi:hypothetical protein